MKKRLVLHIGTMKSGTSFLQSVLATNVRRLRRAGVEPVGGASKGKGSTSRAHPHRAAEELLHGNRGYVCWEAVLDRVESANSAVISSEFFSFLDSDGISTVTDAFSDVELTVVLTVRDQLTAIPAQWQTYTRNFGRAPFDDYLRAVVGTDRSSRRTRAHRTFHRAQDVPTILDRWDVPGVDRLVVVTVPPSGSAPELLWERFCEAGRLGRLEVSLDEIAENQSLGYPACEYLRLANAHLDDLPGRRYRRLMRPVAREALAPLRATQQRPQLDRASAEFALARNLEIRQELDRRPRVELIGDDAELPDIVDLSGYPERVPPPAAEQVWQSTEAVHGYASALAGSPEATVPADLEAAVAETVRLLRQGRDVGAGAR